MIVKSSWRRAGGLEAHLLRTDTNETVRVRTDLFRGADDLHGALRLMEAFARTNPRVVRAFVHVIISPDHDMTDDEIGRALAMVESEHGLSSVLRAVVAHLKGTRAIHIHAVYPVVDPVTGRAVRSHDAFERDELISRRLELAMDERITPGPRIDANVAGLRRRGLDAEADRLAPYLPVRHADPLSRADRQQASRLGVKAAEWSARAFAIFEEAGRDLTAFADRLEAAGLLVARGSKDVSPMNEGPRSDDKVVLLVDDATGYSTSLVRLLRREAKAAGRPLAVKESEVSAAFPHAAPFGQARDAGLERARTQAERNLATERRAAGAEAALDGDVEELEAFRRQARKAREEEDARDRSLAQTTLRARREAIAALYRERDAVRRRRVDRAFQTARLLDTPDVRRAVFALAAAGVLLTGGSLALALAAGVVILELLPTRARARAAAAAARHERAGDAARRRGETDDAYRTARAAARSPAVRFTFDHVPKADRVLAGLLADAMLKGGPPSPEAGAARAALGPEVVAGLTRMLERGSPLQVRRLLHWYRGVAPERREQASKAALQRHAGDSNRGNDRPPGTAPTTSEVRTPKARQATQPGTQRRAKDRGRER